MARVPSLAMVYSSTRDWTYRLHHHVANHGGAAVDVMVVDPQVALQEEFDVFICDDVTSFLTAPFVDGMKERAVSLLGVYDSEHPENKDRLLALGFDDVIDKDAAVEDFMTQISLLAPAERWDDDLYDAAFDEDGDLPSVNAPSSPGQVTVVGGPPGGVGATELAIELARSAARKGTLSVLVDADDVAPSLAQRLQLPLVPNIRTAADGLSTRRRYVSDCLFAVPGGRFSALVGLRSPQDWVNLDPGALVWIVQHLADVHHHVVVNVGSQIESLQGISGDRYGITRAMLKRAGQIVGVGMANPVGVSRLVEWANSVRAMTSRADLHLAVNKAPSERFSQDEIAGQLEHWVPGAQVHFLPDDGNVVMAAWNGDLTRSGPFSRAASNIAMSALPGLETFKRRRYSDLKAAGES